MTRIVVVDYGIGNVKSILRAFEKVNADVTLTKSATEIQDADGLVLPGVGAFQHGMELLDKNKLIDPIKTFAATNRPMLGICLGMQLFFTKGTEFCQSEGLNLVPGKVVKLKSSELNAKLPHIGWANLLEPKQDLWCGSVLKEINAGKEMYFVHSYHAVPDSESHVLSRTEYAEIEFCSSVRKGNIFGCQFHPEKSGGEGLKIIENFVKICKENKE